MKKYVELLVGGLVWLVGLGVTMVGLYGVFCSGSLLLSDVAMLVGGAAVGAEGLWRANGGHLRGSTPGESGRGRG